MHRLTGPAIALLLALVGCTRTSVPTNPAGPAWPLVDEASWFETIGSDGEACYRFDWDDGDTSDWSEYLPAGTGFTAAHRWRSAGRYAVRAQARSANRPASRWTAACSVDVLLLPGYPDTVVASLTLPDDVSALCVAFTPDSRTLCVGSDDARLRLYDVTTLQLVQAVESATAHRVVFSPSGDTAYVSDGQGAVAYDARTWQVLNRRHLGYENYDIALSADGQYLVGCGFDWDTYLKVIRRSDDSIVAEFNDLNDAVLLAAAPGTPYVYVSAGLESDAVYALRTSDMRLSGPMAVGVSPWAMAASWDGRWVYVADWDNDYLWRVRTADNRVEGVLALDWWIGEPTGLAVHPSGRVVYVASDGTVVVDPELRRVVGYVPNAECYDSPAQLAASADGRVLAAAHNNRVAILGFTGHLPTAHPASRVTEARRAAR